MLGRKELPLSALVDPAVIILSASELPALKFELLIDQITIDDLEAFGKYITIEDLKEENINGTN